MNLGWKFIHTQNGLGSSITGRRLASLEGFLGDEDSSKLQMQKHRMDLVQSKKRQGCESTHRGLHLEKNRSPHLGATWEQPPLDTLGKWKEVVGVWRALCNHIPVCGSTGRQEGNLLVSFVICWNWCPAPSLHHEVLVSSLQFLFWQTATTQELHPKVKWIYP